MTKEKTPVIETVNLLKRYVVGPTTINAVNEVSLKIEKGDFVSIVGKSGSGKSTLMHLIGLLDSPTSGQILLNGEDVSGLDEVELAKTRNKEIGFVFQSFNLLPRATTLENVILPLIYSEIPKGEWEKRARDVLELVGLGDRLQNRSNELSGGQKQRVAIARALVTQPSIVFADEPTGNLDTKTGDEIERLFRELNNQGKTIVIVTHDTDLAQIADRQIVISDGKLV